MLSNLKCRKQLSGGLLSITPLFIALCSLSLVVEPARAQMPEVDLLVHSDEVRLDGSVRSIDMSRRRFSLSVDMLLLRDDMSGDLAAPAPRTIVPTQDCRLLDIRRPENSAFRFEQLTPGVETQIVGREVGNIIYARLVIVSGGNLRPVPAAAPWHTVESPRPVPPGNIVRNNRHRSTTSKASPVRTAKKPRSSAPPVPRKKVVTKPGAVHPRLVRQSPQPRRIVEPVVLSRSPLHSSARRNGSLQSATPERNVPAPTTTAIAPTSESRSELPPQLQTVFADKTTTAPRSLVPEAAERTNLPQSRVGVAATTEPRRLPPSLAIASSALESRPQSASIAGTGALPDSDNVRTPDRLMALDTQPRAAGQPIDNHTATVTTMPGEPALESHKLRTLNPPLSGTLTWDLAPRPVPSAGNTGGENTGGENTGGENTRLAALPETLTPSIQSPSIDERQAPLLNLPENSPYWNPARMRFAAISEAQQSLPFTYFSGGSQEQKLVALTFDDGPDPRHTPRVLDILKREGVPATFFLIGRNVEKHPEIVLRAVAEGHEIGNHTFQHHQGGHLTLQQWRDEINSTNTAIVRLLGASPRWFRAPGCRYSQATLQAIAEANMVRVDTTNNSSDWDRRSAKSIHDRIMSRLAPGDVLLFHDGMDQTSLALPRLIHEIRARGYRFVTMTELAKQAQETPGFQPVFHPAGQGIVITAE